MFVNFKLTRRTCFLIRNFYTGKQFFTPSTEDIIFKAICVNLKQKRWNFLKQICPSLTISLVKRVIVEFQDSAQPQLALDFYSWVGLENSSLQSLECCCTLVHLMVKLKRFDDALLLMRNLMCSNGYLPLEIMEGLLNSYEECSSSIAVFDALVRACTQMGVTDGAYEVIKNLKLRDFSVSVHAWNNYLNHLVKLNEDTKFWVAYKEMISHGYVENVYTFNLVIYVSCKYYKFLEALSVYYRMLKMEIFPNVVTFNMMVDGTCKMGDIDLAYKIIRKMGIMSRGFLKPNLVTYNSLINGFCKIGKVEDAEKVRDEITEMGLEPNVRTYATLMDGYSRKGSLDEALRLCDTMVDKGLEPNITIYNSIIHWLYMERDIEGVSLLFTDMMKRQIYPDQFTNAILTKGLCENGYASLALDHHKKNLEKNFLGDNFSHNIVIHYLCRTKNVIGAMQLLCSMYVRGFILDLITYGTLIDGFYKERNLKGALQVYNDLIKVEKNPNLVIYNSMVNSFCKETLIDTAKKMVDVLKNRGALDVITCNTLINGYCENGKFDEAFAFFSEMKSVGILPNIVTYNILINFLCKFGCFEQGKKVMKMMIVQGMVPDFITYTTLITYFKKNCSVEEVIELHDYMVVNGVIPDNQTYKDIVVPLIGEDDAEKQSKIEVYDDRKLF